MSRILLAFAGLSVRMLAEAAREGGFRALALDLFGDADTRRAAEAWLPIGDPARMAIDPDALFAALRGLRAQGASGWIAASGFEADSGVLAAAARLLPLIGNPAEVVAAVRDPANFFSRLKALGIPHPETRFAPPSVAAGWLRKDAGSSGGREVSPVDQAAPAGASEVARVANTNTSANAGNGGIHYQRLAPGEPMSVLFLANGRRSRVLGVNRQIVRCLGRQPFVFRGCIGPLPVALVVRDALQGIVDALAAEFGLRGLNGLDFLLDGERLAVLELNPRPPASIALYPDALPGGLIRAHLAASLAQRLPAEPAMGGRGRGGRAAGAATVRGFEVVFARKHHRIDAAAAVALARLSWCHDLPQHGSSIPRAAPLCTVSAAGSSATEVQALLLQRRRQIPFLLEQHDESSRTFPPEPGVTGQHVLECQ